MEDRRGPRLLSRGDRAGGGWAGHRGRTILTASRTSSVPDIADRHRRYVALAGLAVALVYAANAAEHLAGSDLAGVLELLQIGGALLALAAVAPIILWKVRNRDGDLRRLYSSEEGYVAQALIRAKSASWVTTFVLLSGFTVAAKGFEDVPAQFWIQLTVAVMLAVFAGVFLVLDRGDEPEPESTPRA